MADEAAGAVAAAAATGAAPTLDADAYLAVATEVFDGMDAVLADLDDGSVNRTPEIGRAHV